MEGSPSRRHGGCGLPAVLQPTPDLDVTHQMISRYPDLEALSHATAELFVAEAGKAAGDTGRFTVALSGGRTPRRAFELLASASYRDRVDWARVHVFWGDERCVPPDDERSNERMARQLLLDHVPVPASQIHPMRCAGDPAAAAVAYETLLRRTLGSRAALDLVLLGLGDNGHTASLFPGTPVLAERTRWAADVYVAEQQMFRVTLTAPFINAAGCVAFQVAGAEKAQVVHDVVRGPRDPERLPAQLIAPAAGRLHWLLDSAAAAKLNEP
jgi:6-phosphogluconolactonase